MYYNPVEVIETNNWQKECINAQKSLGIQNPFVITSNGNLKRQKLSTVFNPKSIFSNILPNPTFKSLIKRMWNWLMWIRLVALIRLPMLIFLIINI
jgi:hypothetical protein